MTAPQWSRAGRVIPYTEPYRFREHLFTLRGSPPSVLSIALGGPLPMLAPPEALLWCGQDVAMGVAALSSPGPLLSLMGTGEMAFRSPAFGQLVLLHLPSGAGLVVRWERLVCLAGVSWVPGPSEATQADWVRCSADDGPGLLALGVARAAFELELGAGESLAVAEECLLWTGEELMLRPWGPFASLLCCAGPGLIALDMAGAPAPAKGRS